MLQFRLNRLLIDEECTIPEALGGGTVFRTSPEMVEIFRQPIKQQALFADEKPKLEGQAIKIKLEEVIDYIREATQWQH